MGNISASTPIIGRCIKKPARRVLFLGLDAAGKTTLLYRLKLGEVVTTIPTIGFNVETIESTISGRPVDITAWDVGSRDKIRPLWRHYFLNTDGIVFVVDRTDVDRLSELDDIIPMLSESEIESVPLMFLINKQDITQENAITEETLRNLELIKKMEDQRPIGYFNVSAKTGDGVSEAMQWLTQSMFEERKSKKEATKPEVGAHWLVDAGKRILGFGS